MPLGVNLMAYNYSFLVIFYEPINPKKRQRSQRNSPKISTPMTSETKGWTRWNITGRRL